MACELNEVSEVYRYSLDKKSKKFVCPKCGKKRMVKYVDNVSGQYLDSEVGRCDREVNCAYHFTPKLYFANSNTFYTPLLIQNTNCVSKRTEPTFHNLKLLEASLKYNDCNNFISFLVSILGPKSTASIIDNYKLGTANFWNDGTIFWQQDLEGKIRGGKIIIYQKSGRRTKYINWVHSHLIKTKMLSGFNLKQCFFGEHLLKQNTKPVAIVESEKTACVMSQLFKKYTWLAAGSLRGLTEDKLTSLKQYKVVLYPDLGMLKDEQSPFAIWSKTAHYFSKKGYDICVSDLLENVATESQRKKGLDIADYFLVENNLKNLELIPRMNSVMEDLVVRNKNLKLLVDTFDLVEHVNYPFE
ncbi:MAG: DUF6371 domain-containing protein [Maribacter sp.]